MNSTEDGSPEDTMPERAAGSGWRLWILMRMNRYYFSFIVLVFIFTGLVFLSFFDLTPFRTQVEEAGAIQHLFSSMIGPIITGVTLVVTIGQLVLSQELGAVGDQRERMQSAMKFRRDVESRSRFDVSSPEPASFIRELLTTIEEHGDRVLTTLDGPDTRESPNQIMNYVDRLLDHTGMVGDQLEDAQFGTFDLIWAALNFNYSWKIYELRKIHDNYSEVLSAETNDEIENLLDSLILFAPTREHFKTLYFQWELIHLSRAMLYSAVPALVVVSGMVMYIDADAVTGTMLGIDNLLLITSAALTISLIPFVILLAFILRIVTVAQRTLAMGPFILRDPNHNTEQNS